MMAEFLSHVLALDIAWLVSLVMDNLFFLFAYFAVMHIFLGGKRLIPGFLILTLIMWAWSDVSNLAGAAIFTSGFLTLYYMGKMTVLVFAENSSVMKKKLIVLNELQGYGTWIAYNILICIGVMCA